MFCLTDTCTSPPWPAQREPARYFTAKGKRDGKRPRGDHFPFERVVSGERDGAFLASLASRTRGRYMLSRLILVSVAPAHAISIGRRFMPPAPAELSTQPGRERPRPASPARALGAPWGSLTSRLHPPVFHVHSVRDRVVTSTADQRPIPCHPSSRTSRHIRADNAVSFLLRRSDRCR
jgi:hypothetical protein